MSQLLATLAVIKVNWDVKRDDVAANLMPLVGYAIKTLATDIVTADDVRKRIRDIAEFDLPSGAVTYLIRRAAKPKYGFLTAEGGVYRRRPENLMSLDFERKRSQVANNLNRLFESFQSFSQEKFGAEIEAADVAESFFDALYSLAPNLMDTVIAGNTAQTWDDGKAGTQRYRVSRFIRHAIDAAGSDLEVLKDFVIGAVLTESFYYTNPESVTHKLRNVTVFFDTGLLINILGYCDDAQHQSAMELVDILKAMRARLRYFDRTRNELHGILYAAAQSRAHGHMQAYRPGDVFDHFKRRGSTASDVEFALSTFEKRLKLAGIEADYGPAFEEELGIDEAKLRGMIQEEIQWIQEKALDHDVYALAAVFRLRHGRHQRDFESCDAIFVTSNNALALAAQQFFNAEYGPSNAPVCISETVFTMLMWLKAVDKRPNLPVDRLVANCIAAMNPSPRLWDRYSEAISRALQEDRISEADSVLLLSTLEAKEELMDSVLGREEVFVAGTITDVLAAAKEKITGEAGDRARQAERELANERARSMEFSGKLDRLIEFFAQSAGLVANVLTLAVLLYIAFVFGDDILEAIRERERLSVIEWIVNVPVLLLIAALFISSFVGSSPLGIAKLVGRSVSHWTSLALRRLVGEARSE